MKHFGNVLKQYREEREFTLRELAKLTDLDHTYIHRLEKKEKSVPSSDVVNCLCRTLKLTPRKRELLETMVAAELVVPDALWDAISSDDQITMDAFRTAPKASFRGQRPTTKEQWLELMRELDRNYFRPNE